MPLLDKKELWETW